MKYRILRPLAILAMAVLLLIGTAGCEESDILSLDFIWESIECTPDGNNAHVNATLLKKGCFILDAVGAEDPADWYMLPLPGDVLWDATVRCITNDPGLRVGFYADTGSGLELIIEESPELRSEGGVEIYATMWEIDDLISQGSPNILLPPGNYYIRITYYTYYTGNHPYILYSAFGPGDYLQSANNTLPTAKPLPPGIMHTGHLDSQDPYNAFTFEIADGQSGTGIIAIEPASLVNAMMIGYPSIPTFSIKANLRRANSSLITTILVSQVGPSFIDLSNFGPLVPGTYYIDLAFYTSNPDPDDFYYTVFNHALAPDTGTWANDNNEDTSTAESLQVGVPVTGSVFWPRDEKDFYKFNSPYYFIGDVRVDTSVNGGYIECSVGDENITVSSYFGAGSIPGLGCTNRFDPIPPGDLYLLVEDTGRFFSPTEYSARLYPHGPPGSAPSGHDTWQDALELKAMDGLPESGMLRRRSGNVVFHLKPGLQETYYTTLTVPEEEYLVGYYDIYGSRPNYRVFMGKLGPGESPIWSPALNPDPDGKLTIDMNYDYLSDAGTYFLKFEMLQPSPGRMRVLIDNHSIITGCTADTNNDYFDAQGLYFMSGYDEPKYGAFCPPDDIEDWYTLSTSDFNPQAGPHRYLRLRGSVNGMTIRLYDNDLLFKGEAVINEVGGIAKIDLKGLVQPNKSYKLKVSANPQEERIQIYELEYKSDLLRFKPEFTLKKKLEILPGKWKLEPDNAKIDWRLWPVESEDD